MDKSEAFAALLEKIKARGDTYAYFFDRLESPALLPALAEAGFFKEPPGIEELENGFVRFPLWPESRALARLAEVAEEEVLPLILEANETDNPRVHDDFAEAANKMSPQNGARLVPHILSWLNSPYKLLLPLKAGVLMERLAQGGEIQASLNLAQGLLQLSERTISGSMGDDELFGSRREVSASFDNYEYQTILEGNVPGFVRATRIEGLALLCELLERALFVEASQLGGPPADASYIWRPSIADHEQNHDWDPHDFLVTSIRDSADLLVAEGTPLTEAIEALGNRNWHVFERIAMYLASKWAEQDPRPGVELMLRRDLFGSYEVSREYDALLGVLFARSAESDQRTLLDWIDEGPDLSAYAERVALDSGTPPADEDLIERADRWRWDRLARLPVGALPEEWQRRAETLATRYGSPADFPVTMTGYTGTESPVDMTEAESWTTEQLAQQAEELPTTSDQFASPEEGYADLLESIAQEQPVKLSSGLEDFIDKRPLYLRSILRGLERAIGDSADHLEWSVIMSVAEWIMAQPRAINGGSGGRYSDLDPGWVWTRGTLADLIEKGLRVGGIPSSLRERVWSVLQSLMSDPDADGDHDPDAAERSLNSIRGKAMHAITMYAMWVFESAQTEPRPSPAPSLHESMPEVENELDSRLDASVEPSRAIRAVFGLKIRLLMWLDREWVASRAQRIFSVGADGHLDSLGRAAWEGYVLYGRGNLDTMQLLRPQYEVAVGELDRDRPTANEVDEGRPFGPTDRPRMLLDNVERHLADHVMVLYWHGQLGDDPREGGLVRDLFENGNGAVRHRALEFVGRSLREAGTDLDEQIRNRLKRLFEFRLEAVRVGTEADRKEVQAFGWWMESEALDSDWLMRNLLDVLSLNNRIDVDYLVVSALVNLDDPQLEDALRSLILVVRADSDGWGVYGWKDPAYRLIQRGMNSSKPECVELATDAANLLIARGFHEFRELVPVDR